MRMGRQFSFVLLLVFIETCCCQDDIRLVGGSGPKGRVEVLVDGEWGTICDDLWDINDANVVCRQLGYPGAEIARDFGYFGEGSGRIWLDNVECTGDEETLADCLKNRFGDHNCQHYEDAGVECQMRDESSVTEEPLPTTPSSNLPYRDDYRCGGSYRAPNGEVAECNPNGIYPCCSPYNWCGITTDHCDCGECIDYRNFVTRTIEDIRLVDGSSGNIGRVEVLVHGRWGTVCDDDWDINDATVVCRQLGYSGADSAEGFAYFGEGFDPIWLDNVDCSGQEDNLNDCPKNDFGVHNCNHYEDAGVRCSNTETVAPTEITGQSSKKFRDDYQCGGDYLAPNGQVAECDPDGIYPCCSPYNWCGITTDHCDCEGCIDYRSQAISDVRLVGGDSPNAGRVEVLVGSEWGTVCDDDWDLSDAEVICRILGYTGARDYYSTAHFGKGSGPIWIDNLECSGNEDSLNDCSKNAIGDHNCGHHEDASVRCILEEIVETTNQSAFREDYRCGGDNLAPNGEVAQCDPNGIYPCCSPYNWCGITPDHCDCEGCVDYRVIGKSYRDDYLCGGSYLAPNGEVAQCNPNGIYPCCSPYNWCGITADHCDCDGCIDYRPPVPPVIEDIRLAGGTTENAGRVEVLINGEWGTVCDDLWDQNDADVVCRQLGYTGASYYRYSAFFGQGEGPIWLDNVECTGSEESLEECQKNEIGEENCAHSEDVGVGCTPLEDATSIPGEQTIKDIRLVDGASDNQGRVEVFVDGQWGTVCDDDWDLEDAEVVCRQLGYSGASAFYRGATFGEGTGLIWLDNVQCTGGESSLNECEMNDIGDENCGHFEDAGVTCTSDVTVSPAPGTSTQRWRDDFQCGGSLLAPNGQKAECNPNGPNPCCSPFGWCDVTPSHCECDGCIDYRVTDASSASPTIIQDIRLADGQTVNMGRVEVLVNGVWGTVCDDLWDMNDATVVCKQLGFPGAESARQDSYFGTGSDTIWLDNVECVGDEATLDECPKNDIGDENCGGSEHAGVVCHPWDIPPASASDRWRADYRCGGEFYAPNGEVAECNPTGTNPCCSPYNWCDVTPSHCDCEGCIDYRETDVSSTDSWRDDYQCGGNYLAPNGEVAQCDPEGIYPCCSPYNWCGITADHCDCEGCIDYRVNHTTTRRWRDDYQCGELFMAPNGGVAECNPNGPNPCCSPSHWCGITPNHCDCEECIDYRLIYKKYREDYRCGGNFLAPNGEVAECDPEGIYPCCSPANWCGITADHCDCTECIDYRPPDPTTQQRWRDDFQCGEGFLAPNGMFAECNPDGPNPCCSPHNWCDITPSHCECDGCIDYRLFHNVQTKYRDDARCGGNFLAPNGEVAECDPEGDYPCCSRYNYCGITAAHCDCTECIDYRNPVTTTLQRWRDDFRCGGDFLAPNGEIAECDPNGPNPCCSQYNWCDVTPSHCECDGCIDYRTRYQDIRIVGGQSENEGRVEVQVNGEWGTVCDDEWDLSDAKVVCNELGYSGVEAYFTNSHFGGGTGNIWLDNVQCSGDENSLNDCTKNRIGEHNCGHDEDAGVTCTARESTTEATPGYQNIRLVGGQSENEGRVEVQVNGEWGTVCDDEWDLSDAKVVCNELGYPGVEAYFTNSHFGGGTGDIWLDNVQCSGEEDSLNYCTKNRIGDHNCGHDEDAGVTCIARDSITEATPGTTTQQRWRDDYQCGDGFLAPNGEVAECNPNGPNPCCSPHNWCDVTPSHCECEGCIDYRLIYNVQTKYREDYRCGGNFLAPNGEVAECDPEGIYPCCSPYNWCGITAGHCDCTECIDYRNSGTTTPQRWRDDFRCGGDFLAPNGEIAECDPNGPNPCCSPHNWCDVTPSHCECDGCIDYRMPRYQDIRLVGGQSENQGRVEVQVNGEWGTVCDDEWDLSDAKVVCNELGYPGVEAYFTNSHFGRGTGDIWLDNVQCSGEETSLNNCTKNRIGDHNCGHDEDAGVRCTARESTTERTSGYQNIRLVGVQSENEGRVEVMVNGEWGTVCDDEWDLSDAKVVCNELGYPGVEAYFTNSHFGGGTGDIWLDNVQCSGEENSLNDCTKNRIGDHNCGHDEDAGVRCTARESTTESTPGYQDIRLVGGQSENEGRVEVQVNGEWGTVCDDEWDLSDAKVVCNELGYPGVEAYFTNSYFGEGTGNIWLDNVQCSGEENSLNNCTKNRIGYHNCGHDEDAGVTCTARDSITNATSGVDSSTSSICEPLRSSLCQGMPYNLTSLQSGNSSQEDAEQILSLTFQLVIPLGCPAGFFQFMCLQSMPPCESTGIPTIPCKELCETGIKVCYEMLEASGVPIPPLDLDCSLFPAEETGLCFAEDPSGVPYEDTETYCEEITIPLCQDLPYNSTRLPNLLGHDSQSNAGLEISQFSLLTNFECSPYFREFFCSLYTPPCYVERPDPPCKELCLAAKEGCNEVITAFGFSSPESLNCDQLPSVTLGTPCYAGQIARADPSQDYREDYRCGGDYLAPNGDVAKCKKDGQYPCCSPDKWCGITSDHCDCSGCIDYRYHD